MPGKYELSNIKVSTVGLVDNGAVQEDFMLVKRGGKEMSEPEEQGFLEKLETLFKKYFGAKEEPKETIAPVEEVAKTETVTPVTPDPVVDLSKKVETLETESAELKTQLAKAQEDLAKAAEEKTRIEWIEKADVCKSLPVKKDDLGSRLAKLDKETADWFYAVLKAADKMLADAGVFAEVGTTESGPSTMNEKIQSVMKSENKSFEDALLSLSNDEQSKYIAETRKHSGGKK